MKSILIYSDKNNIAESFAPCFAEGSHVDAAASEGETRQKLQKRAFNFLFFDIDRLAADSNNKITLAAARKSFSRYWELQPTLEIVIICTTDRIHDAVVAIKAGANNYVTYPIHKDEVSILANGIYQERITDCELEHLRNRFWGEDAEEDVNTQSKIMQKTLELIKVAAPTRSTILLTGKTGTGKSRLAKLIHRYSSRKDGPFISVNCGALADSLIESELFGHEKGAFTGAVRLKLGKFEIARGGTLFLDEIGTISPAAQVRLLTVIQENEFQRVGGETTIKSDIRLIAATNMDLNKLVENKEFREDLFFRLNVFPISIPCLKDRSEDIPMMVSNMLKKFARLNQKNITGVQPSVLDALQNYSWPGNIRELENMIERATILETSDTLTPESFPQEIISRANPGARVVMDFPMTLAEMRKRTGDDAERQYLKAVLTRCRGLMTRSAEEAGITPRQFRKLLTKHAIQKSEYKQQ